MENENASRDELRICTVQQLAEMLGVDARFLIQMAVNPEQEYRSFKLWPKRRPFQRRPTTGRSRLIHEPSPLLKPVQLAVNRLLQRLACFPPYVCGGIKRKSILDNVRIHRGGKILVTIDIRDFFPTVTAAQVYRVWDKLLSCPGEVSALLTHLTTLGGHLPQGAPTSTTLGNLVLREVDEDIVSLCEKEHVRYSRWVDDIALSGDHPERLIGTVIQVLRRAGFRVRHRKVKVMRSHRPKKLTGLVLGSSITVPRERLRWIRSGIHKLRTNSIGPHESDHLLRRLDGEISYVAMVSPTKGNRLREQFIFAETRMQSSFDNLSIQLGF